MLTSLYLLKYSSLEKAFLTTASRLVGATFRTNDAYNPKLRQKGITPAPNIVIEREAISIGIAWAFTLFTANMTTSVIKKLKMGETPGTFITIAFGNIIAEGVSRLLAYRTLKNKPQLPTGRSNSPAAQRPFSPLMPTASYPVYVPCTFPYH